MIDEIVMKNIIPLPDEEEEMEKIQRELESEGFPVTGFKKGGVFYHICRMLLKICIELKKLARTILNSCFISSYVPAIEAVEEVVDEEGNVITPAIAGSEEIPEVRDTLISVTLLKSDDLEQKIEDTNKTVNAVAVAMAKIMGE